LLERDRSMKKYNIKHPIEDMLLNIAQQYSE
jgi:hypothetical protein